MKARCREILLPGFRCDKEDGHKGQHHATGSGVKMVWTIKGSPLGRRERITELSGDDS